MSSSERIENQLREQIRDGDIPDENLAEQERQIRGLSRIRDRNQT